MWQWWIIIAFTWLGSQSDYDQPDIAQPSTVPTVHFITEETPSAKPDAAAVQLALSAMDRQCGNCHHPNRSNNKAALAIFDLADECWYCPLSLSQADDIKNRTKTATFSDEERQAIASLLDQLAVSK